MILVLNLNEREREREHDRSLILAPNYWLLSIFIQTTNVNVRMNDWLMDMHWIVISNFDNSISVGSTGLKLLQNEEPSHTRAHTHTKYRPNIGQ